MILLSSAEAASSKEISALRRTRAAASETYVVNLAFYESNLPPEDKLSKNTLEEVHTFAELKHDPRASLPGAFTVCSTIMIAGYQSEKYMTFFNILDKNGSQILFPFQTHGVIKNELGLRIDQSYTQLVTGQNPPLFPNQWVRGCMAVNTTSGLIHWVVAGTLVLAKNFEELKNSEKSPPKDLSRRLVLGAKSYGGSWTASAQKVTNLDIYSSPLAIEKMKSITRGGSCVEEGDYLAWGDMTWILHGQARKESTEKEEMCEEKPLVDLYYTQFPGMDTCMHHCLNLGTRAPSVTTLKEWTKLQAFLKEKLFDRGLNTLQIWLPITDRETEDVWKDFYTGEDVHNYTHPWIGSLAGEAENCARLYDGNNWADRECEISNYACMCSQKPTSNLKLRGLCPGSAVDVHYTPMNKRTDIREMKLHGLTQTLIRFVEQDKMWTLDVTQSNVTGTSTASFASFTLGKHNWTIKGDKGCSSGATYVTELKMSGCQDGNFTCNDGQCVSMDRRCNQLPDCRDESDEMNCEILVLKVGYNKKVPPVKSTDPVKVSVSIDLLKLVDIDEEDYSIEIQFEISLVWKERRATYQNLKKRDSLNSLSEKDIGTLWLPKVIYENTDQKETTRLGDNWEWETRVVVRRQQENGTLSGLESVDETEIFKGSENSLVMNQTYTHTFQCNYQLSYYPFDTQVKVQFYP